MAWLRADIATRPTHLLPARYGHSLGHPIVIHCVLKPFSVAIAGRSKPPWWRTTISASGRRRDACYRPASPATVLRHRPGRESLVRRTALEPSSPRSIPSPPEKRGAIHLGCRSDPRPLGRRRTGLSAPRRSRREAGSGQHGNPTPEPPLEAAPSGFGKGLGDDGNRTYHLLPSLPPISRARRFSPCPPDVTGPIHADDVYAAAGAVSTR